LQCFLTATISLPEVGMLRWIITNKTHAHTPHYTKDSFITPVGSMTSLVRASITFYVEYRQSDFDTLFTEINATAATATVLER